MAIFTRKTGGAGRTRASDAGPVAKGRPEGGAEDAPSEAGSKKPFAQRKPASAYISWSMWDTAAQETKVGDIGLEMAGGAVFAGAARQSKNGRHVDKLISELGLLLIWDCSQKSLEMGHLAATLHLRFAGHPSAKGPEERWRCSLNDQR